jgi:hypothetical protein
MDPLEFFFLTNKTVQAEEKSIWPETSTKTMVHEV